MYVSFNSIEWKFSRNALFRSCRLAEPFHANLSGPADQGCQMVSFQTKNPNLGKLWRALHWRMLIYFMALRNILQTFGIFYDHLVHFGFIWYNLFCFGTIYQEKYGNPAAGFPSTHYVGPVDVTLHSKMSKSPN
jgi:hypothetical protein